MSALFDELRRITQLHAYATTGDERHLKDLPPIQEGPLMGFNDPTHLPPPRSDLMPTHSLVFDIYDDDLMKDLIGGRLTKPVQALLQVHDMQWEHCTKEHLDTLIKDLRVALREEFADL